MHIESPGRRSSAAPRGPVDQRVRLARRHDARSAVPDGAGVRRAGQDPRPVRHARSRDHRRGTAGGVRRDLRGAAGRAPVPRLDGGSVAGARSACRRRLRRRGGPSLGQGADWRSSCSAGCRRCPASESRSRRSSSRCSPSSSISSHRVGRRRQACTPRRAPTAPSPTYTTGLAGKGAHVQAGAEERQATGLADRTAHRCPGESAPGDRSAAVRQPRSAQSAARLRTSHGTCPASLSGASTGSPEARRSGSTPAQAPVARSVSSSTGGPARFLTDASMQRDGDHGGGGQLLARVRAQRRRPTGHDVVDDQVERVHLLCLCRDQSCATDDHRGAVVHRVVEGRPGQHQTIDTRAP